MLQSIVDHGFSQAVRTDASSSDAFNLQSGQTGVFFNNGQYALLPK